MNRASELKELKQEQEFFIGIDSDGCVFDSMGLKHNECFCPNFIKSFELQKVQKYARETWDFVNLYSQFRGLNRFIAVLEAFRLMKERPEIQARGMELPDMKPLEDWVQSESKLGNPALEEYVKTHDDEILHKALEWSYGLNASVSEMVYGVPPFPRVIDALQKMQAKADIIVVSQTPLEALVREWKENDMDGYVKVIAGQEHGTKAEHLALAAKGKYDGKKILMIGDAPGDYQAAQTNGVLFYPINPGAEEASWEKLYNEALDRFFEGTYAGEYEHSLIAEFNKILPAYPAWETNSKSIQTS